MILTDYFVLDTPHGEKTIEFRNMDITKIDMDYDVLILSAYINSYIPIPRTVIAALENEFGISIEKLSHDPEIDLRDELQVWVSQKLKGYKFSRIMVVLLQDIHTGYRLDLRTVINNMYGALALAHLRDIPVKKIAMPLIGTGDMGIGTQEVLEPLLIETKAALQKLSELETVIFCEINEKKAKELSNGLNKIMKRSNLKITPEQRQDILQPVLNDINKHITKLCKNDSQNLFDVIREWKRLYQETNPDIKNYGHFCRIFTERFLYYFLGTPKGESSNKRIESLKYDLNFASWVTSYLHLLRITGNYYAHPQENKTTPSELEFKDILIALNALARVTEFWKSQLK